MFCKIAAILLITLSVYSSAFSDNQTFNVKDYGAVGDGVHDDTFAMQLAIDAAIKGGSNNTVFVPTGTFLIADGPLRIEHATNLTFTGSGANRTMLWYTYAHPAAYLIESNNGVTLEGFSTDVQKRSGTDRYDLGETQGSITSINAANKTITIKVEGGYPLLSQPNIQASIPTGWHSAWMWFKSDPSRPDVDDPGGYSPTMQRIDSDADGTAGTIKLEYIPARAHVGEEWIIYPDLGNICFNICYNTGITTLRNINYYGGAVNWMGAANYNSGPLVFTHLYCGPPPYQPDRAITCNEGWAMSMSSRGSLTVTNSTFLRTYDDIFDRGCDSTLAVSQAAPNQLVVKDGNQADYEVGDTVELYDFGDASRGVPYGKSLITGIQRTQSRDWLLTLDGSIVLKNPKKDFLSDLSDAGPVVAANDTFNCASGRNVFFRGKSVVVTNCTFEFNTPCILGGWEDGEGPAEAVNITVTGCTFFHSAGLAVEQNGGNDTPITGGNITINDNRFINCGFYGQQDSHPLHIANVAGVKVENNFFDDNWGVNADLQHDADVTLDHNTFLSPNQALGRDADDTSVISLKDVNGGSLSGNIVDHAEPYTSSLTQADDTVLGVKGLETGTVDIDNPLTFYNPHDNMVLTNPVTGSVLRQAPWFCKDGQLWNLVPAKISPGAFEIKSLQTSLPIGNAMSRSPRSEIDLETVSGTTDFPSASQLWIFDRMDDSSSNVVKIGSGLAMHIKGDSPLFDAKIIQWAVANSESQNYVIVAPPKAFAKQRDGAVTVTWVPAPGAASYAVGRSTVAGGPYKIVASNIAASPFVDGDVIKNTPYYYVVSALGQVIGNIWSNEVCVVPGSDSTPVDLESAFDVVGIELPGTAFRSEGYSGNGASFSEKLTGRYVNWNDEVFNLGAPGTFDVASDSGQRIFLPRGSYSNLNVIGSSASGNLAAISSLTVTIIYLDGSRTTETATMSSWRTGTNQPGESNTVSYPKFCLKNGSTMRSSCFLHGYSFTVDPKKEVDRLELGSSGACRVLAANLESADEGTPSADK